jgi:hypothetical protein
MSGPWAAARATAPATASRSSEVGLIVEGRRRALGGGPILSRVVAGGGATTGGAADVGCGIANLGAGGGGVGGGGATVGDADACAEAVETGSRVAAGAASGSGANVVPWSQGFSGSCGWTGCQRGRGSSTAAARAGRSRAGGVGAGRSGPDGDRDGGRLESALCRASGRHRVSDFEVIGSDALRGSNGQFGRSRPLKRGMSLSRRSPAARPGLFSSALPFCAPEYAPPRSSGEKVPFLTSPWTWA